ncbi:MAG TPA: hypothetical protein VN457_00250, partial [Chlamydiales bacterium]|nr:hypothetical protein [Chlamydiales bacterium]
LQMFSSSQMNIKKDAANLGEAIPSHLLVSLLQDKQLSPEQQLIVALRLPTYEERQEAMEQVAIGAVDINKLSHDEKKALKNYFSEYKNDKNIDPDKKTQLKELYKIVWGGLNFEEKKEIVEFFTHQRAQAISLLKWLFISNLLTTNNQQDISVYAHLIMERNKGAISNLDLFDLLHDIPVTAISDGNYESRKAFMEKVVEEVHADMPRDDFTNLNDKMDRIIPREKTIYDPVPYKLVTDVSNFFDAHQRKNESSR